MVRRNEQLHAIRTYQRRRAAEGTDPREVALEIFRGWPGVARLESWRLGRGWSLEEAAEHIRHNLVRFPTAKRSEAGLSGKGLQDIEQGRTRVSLDYAMAIAWTYQIPIEHTGLVDPHLQRLDSRADAGGYDLPRPGQGSRQSPTTSTGGFTTRRRPLLKLAGAAVLGAGGLLVDQFPTGLSAAPIRMGEVIGAVSEAESAVRRAEASAVGPLTLELVEQRAEELATAGRVLERPVLFRHARQHRQQAVELLGGEHTTTQELRLRALAASMNGLMAVALLGVGQCQAAWTHALAAEQHAGDAHDLELVCWAASTKCMIRFYQGRYPEAVRVADAATVYVQPGSPAGIRLLLNLARAAANAGDSAAALRALRHCDRYWNTLPPGEMSNSMFGMNDAFRTLYQGTTLALVGKGKDAAGCSRQALKLYTDARPLERAPAKQGVAWLDVAVAQLVQGDVDQAAHTASAAVAPQWGTTVDWMVLRRAVELDSRLAKHHRVGAVGEFHEQLQQVMRQAATVRG